jgi:predicted nuclease of predicted toxin-antitoxin system
MKVRFYFDEMMPRPPVEQLANRGIETVMANDVNMTEKSDDAHLIYATENGFVLVTFDRAFAGRTAKQTDHTGLILLSGQQDDVGMIVRTLTEFAEEYTAEDAQGNVFWR